MKGRRGVIEVLELTPEIQEAILNGISPSLLRRSQIAEGTFKDLWDDGLRLVFEGVIGFEQLEKELRPYLSDRVGAPKNRQEKAGFRPVRESGTSSLVAQL